MVAGSIVVGSVGTSAIAKKISESAVLRKASPTTMSLEANRLSLKWSHLGAPVGVSVRLPENFNVLNALRRLDERENSSIFLTRKIKADPFFNTIIAPVAAAITSLADGLGEDPAAMMLEFVQGIPYYERPLYQVYPSQLLLTIDGGGDCSDLSILYAALLEAYQRQNRAEMGSTPLWVLVVAASERRPDHTYVGIRRHSRGGTKQSYRGGYVRVFKWKWSRLSYRLQGTYYAAETTNFGYRIGEFPQGIRYHMWAASGGKPRLIRVGRN